MEAGSGRVLYIDESGDSDTSLVLAGLSFESGLDVDAEAATQEVISNLASVLPGLDASKEIHAHKLARELRQKEIRERRDEVLLRNHERDFVYQHLLHHLAGWTSARLHLVMWNWGGPGHGKDSRKGERQRILMARLLEWVAEENETIDRIWIDASSQHRHYVRGFAEVAETSGLFLREPEQIDSKESRLIQLADLAGYAAYQRSNPARRKALDRMQSWYREALQDIWADGGDGHGCRHFEGKLAQPK
jgi:hypothetical protein